MQTVLFQSVDSISPATVDYASLEQTQLMELLVRRIANHKAITDKECRYKDLSEWPGVIANCTGDIVAIQWMNNEWLKEYPHSGSFMTEFLPRTVKVLLLPGSNFEGDFKIANLPDGLEDLDVRRNSIDDLLDTFALPRRLMYLDFTFCFFRGLLDLRGLPRSMVSFQVGMNRLTGSLHLESLPKQLRVLNVRNNQFSGTVDLTSLPATLEELLIRECHLHGEIDLNHLPTTLAKLHICVNQFSGRFVMKRVPPNLQVVWAEKNCFSGDVILGALPDSLERLVLWTHDDRAVLDIHGSPLEDVRVQMK